MPEYLLRQGQSQRHQEDGPVDRMEADNVLPDQMQVSRPQLLKLLCAVSVRIVPDPCDIVSQGIQPHIGHMLRIKVHRDPPLKRGPGHAQILKSREQEVIHHLILPGHRLDELRMLIDILDQPVRILAHLEEICLFLRRLDLAPAVRTFPVHELGLCEKGLARRAVHAFIISFINISLLIELLKDLLHLLLMVCIRRTDKFVIRSIHQIPDPLDLSRHIVHELLRSDPCFLCLELDLLSVLVRPCLEEHIVSLAPLVARDRVREHDLIGVSDVRLA